MKNIYKFMGLGLLVLLFLLNFIPHYDKTPLHIDSWIQFSWAKESIRNEQIEFVEPFSGHSSSYPPGVRIFLSSVMSVTGLELPALTPILAGLLMVALDLSFYLLAKELFGKKEAGLAVMAFTPLVLSNITVLGPFFVVPLTFGMIFSMILFYFALRENVIFTIIFYVLIVLTHRSTSVFAGIGLGLILLLKLWERKYWTVGYMGIAPLCGIGVYGILKSFESIQGMVSHYLINSKQPPYISFKLLYTSHALPFYYMFIILLAIGLYLIILREKKARYFLVGLFALLALNAFAYQHWEGFLLVYRRLFGFIFLLVPFFVGYSIYYAAGYFSARYAPYVMIGLFVIFLPWAVVLSDSTNKYPYVYVTAEEHQLFKKFSNEYPGEHLVATHLQYHALPYYNISPVMGNIVATGSELHFDELYPCFSKRDEACFEEFFEKHDYKYIYTKFPLESESFEKAIKHQDRFINKYRGKNI